MAKLKDDRDKSTPLIREVFKLRYLQPVTGGRLNLAGQVQGGQGSANIQTLEEAIRRILRAGNDQRADVTRVPGRSEFIVVGTPEQISQIRELIERVRLRKKIHPRNPTHRCGRSRFACNRS